MSVFKYALQTICLQGMRARESLEFLQAKRRRPSLPWQRVDRKRKRDGTEGEKRGRKRERVRRTERKVRKEEKGREKEREGGIPREQYCDVRVYIHTLRRVTHCARAHVTDTVIRNT